MEDKKALNENQAEKISGGGDRDGSFIDPRPVEEPIMDCCPYCYSHDATQTRFVYPYAYVCNSCGKPYMLP